MKPIAFRCALPGDGSRGRRRGLVLLVGALLTLALWGLIFLGWSTISAWLA